MSQENKTPNKYSILFKKHMPWFPGFRDPDKLLKLEDKPPEYTINMEESIDMPGKYGQPFPLTITKDWFPDSKVYIHPTVILGPDVEIGEGTYIGPYCIIGYPAEHKEYWNEDCGKVIIGKNCVITGHVTIDAGTTRPTHIMDNCWLLKHSHVGHDALIGPNSTISCGAKVGGHAGTGHNVNIGLNACIHQWIFVPEGCMVGMNSTITKKTPLQPFRKYAGSPARDIGPNQPK